MPHTPTTPTTAPSAGGGDDAGDDGFPPFGPFDMFRDIPPPEYLIDGLIEDRALSAVVGASGAGKSAVVLDMILSVARGLPWKGHPVKRTRVLYIAGEGVSGAAQRVKAWETQHAVGVGQDLFMIPEAVLLSGSDAHRVWPWLAANVRANDIGLVVFDTLARMAIGLDENSAQDMGKAVGMFDRLRKESGAGVMVVHHTKRGAETARGSSALFGALDSEVLVRKADEDDDGEGSDGLALEVVSTKQKNAPVGTETNVWLRSGHGSVIVTDANGGTGDDPFSALVVRPTRIRSAPDELAVRAYHVLADFPDGLTVSDLSTMLSEDKDMEPPSKADMLRAVQRGKTTLILHAEGSRIKTGVNTPEQARQTAGLLN